MLKLFEKGCSSSRIYFKNLIAFNVFHYFILLMNNTKKRKQGKTLKERRDMMSLP